MMLDFLPVRLIFCQVELSVFTCLECLNRYLTRQHDELPKHEKDLLCQSYETAARCRHTIFPLLWCHLVVIIEICYYVDAL